MRRIMDSPSERKAESRCGQRLQRDRFEGRADAVVADLGRRDAALLCDELGDVFGALRAA
jgi:hypothetical protein